MRILRLDFDGDMGTIDLHPFISVLHDFGPAQNEAMVDAIRSLVNGSGEGIPGLVENGGHLLELGSPETDAVGPLTTEDIVVRVDAHAIGEDGDPATLEAELDQVRRAAEIDAVYVEEIRADLKPSVAAEVQRLRDELGQIGSGRETDIERSVERMRQMVAEMSSVPAVFREIPEEVEELIGAWDGYVVARDDAQPHMDGLRQAIQQADAALGTAQSELAECQADAKPVLLSDEEEQRLEDFAHPPMDRRGRRSKGLSPEEEAEMQELLAKVGVPTYTGYAMYRLNPTPSPEMMAEVEKAEARVLSAQAELDEARAALEVDDTAVGLGFQFDEVKAKAREHLGPMLPSDLGAALGELVIEVDNPDYTAALAALRDGAAEEGIPFPDNLEPAQLPLAVSQWIDHQESQAEERPIVDEAALRERLAKAEEALDRHARAMGRIDRLEARAAESAGEVGDLESQLARISTGDNQSADGVLSAIRPLLDRIKGENDGSVPIVLQGEFTDLGDDEIDVMMNDLEAVAQQHQLILITDRRKAATWASNVGLRRALRTTSHNVEDTYGVID